MKCCKCGADSDVVETRAFKTLFVRRRRRCFNQHLFTSIEVLLTQIDTRRVEKAVRGAERRKLAAKRRSAVSKNYSRPIEETAAKLDMSVSMVKKIRASLRAEKATKEPHVRD